MTVEEERDRYKEALESIVGWKEDEDKGWRAEIKSLIGIAKVALNPPPQYRDEEVIQWAVMYGNSVEGVFDTEQEAADHINYRGSGEAVKLTGTRKVEVKPKVKRRQQIEGTYAIHQGYDNTIWESQP